MTTGLSAILLVTLEVMALQYDQSQLSNAQSDFWPHPWRNVILFVLLSAHWEFETKAARIIRRLPNDNAQTSGDYALSEMYSATLLICFTVFAFFKPPLQEEIRQLEALPVLAPRDTFISLILNARGRVACSEFRDLLVLRLRAHSVCINVQTWINYVYHLYEQR